MQDFRIEPRNSLDGTIDWEDQLDKPLEAITSREFSIQADIERLSQSVSLVNIQPQITAVNRMLGELRNCLDSLKKEAECQDTNADAVSIMDKVSGHEMIVKDLQHLLSKAVLTAKVNREKKVQMDRDALLANIESPSTIRARKHVSTKEKLKVASQDYTDSLYRTRSMLADTIVRSGQALDVLQSSVKTMEDTRKEFKDANSELRAGKGLLRKLESRARTDRILLYIGLLFFFLTVLYIVKKRLSPWIPSIPIPSFTNDADSLVGLKGGMAEKLDVPIEDIVRETKKIFDLGLSETTEAIDRGDVEI